MAGSLFPLRVAYDRPSAREPPPNWPWKGHSCPARTRIALAAVVAAFGLAVVAAPASASVPGGQGLGIFGLFDCGDPLGVVEVFGAPAVASRQRLPDRHGGERPARRRDALRIQVCCGEVFFEKNFGQKAGLTTFTCTQTGDLGDVFTLTVAVVHGCVGRLSPVRVTVSGRCPVCRASSLPTGLGKYPYVRK